MDLQAAADRLGVHYQTAYRWVRDGSLKAVKRGACYDVDEQELRDFAVRRAAPTPPPRQASVRSWEPQRQRLYRALVDGDELGARAVVDRLAEGGIAVVTLCEELFAPVLRWIGDEWAQGRISVAEEHRASAICERLLARLSVHPRGRPRGVVVVATPPGDQHGLPATMAAVALRADRWQVHHLGTQVPAEDLVELAVAVGTNVVVLSVTNPEARPEAERVAEAAQAAGVAVLVGGNGLTLRDLLERVRG